MRVRNIGDAASLGVILEDSVAEVKELVRTLDHKCVLSLRIGPMPLAYVQMLQSLRRENQVGGTSNPALVGAGAPAMTISGIAHELNHLI